MFRYSKERKEGEKMFTKILRDQKKQCQCKNATFLCSLQSAVHYSP